MCIGDERRRRGVIQLTHGDDHSWAAVWSPDGKRLAFNSDRTGRLEIYVTKADGTDQRQLTSVTHGMTFEKTGVAAFEASLLAAARRAGSTACAPEPWGGRPRSAGSQLRRHSDSGKDENVLEAVGQP